MALKFLNKKGWHTGSLRNIENVWKAEQKHEAEQKKLEELRKQIVEERERSEFRLLQEQAGLVPKQERLEFLYDSGLAVGKGSSSSGGGFKALESSSLPPPPKPEASSSSTKPGALFEEKQQSSNDAWRKLHSDPLLMIRQREQEALSRVKNNPVQMAMIRKSVEADTKTKKKKHDDDAPRRKHRHKKKHDKESSPKHHSDLDNYTSKERRKSSGTYNTRPISEDELSGEDIERRSSSLKSYKYREGRSSKRHSDSKDHRKSRPSSEDELSGGDIEQRSSSHKNYKYKEGQSSKHHSDSDNYTSKEGRKSRPGSEDELSGGGDIERRSSSHKSYKYKEGRSSALPEPTTKKNDTGEQKGRQDDSRRLAVIRETKPLNMHRKQNPVKLSEEERSARLREMERDAEIHDEQRWKRLKKAEERDVEEAIPSKGRSFLDAVQKSVYGTAKGGSSTIEESVRRRTHYSQGRSEAGEGNAFRR